MWGRRIDLNQAIKQWNALAENVLAKELQERSKRKVKGWAKPEKALTDKQKRKIERRKAREREERDYRGFPPEQKSFNGHFLLPNSDIPIARIIGEKEEILHPIRADTKCYMWYEPSSNVSILFINKYKYIMNISIFKIYSISNFLVNKNCWRLL